MVDRQDIDALLISALYGELTPADEARLQVHLESHPTDRTALAGLTLARNAVRESRILQVQIEPPQAISALLLQEAARRAPAKSAPDKTDRESWFQRFVRSFVAHPAMAAAAMLVVVLGVAGTMYLRGENQFAEQTAHRDEPTVAMSAPSLTASDAGLATLEQESLRLQNNAGSSFGATLDDGGRMRNAEGQPDPAAAEKDKSKNEVAKADQQPADRADAKLAKRKPGDTYLSVPKVEHAVKELDDNTGVKTDAPDAYAVNRKPQVQTPAQTPRPTVVAGMGPGTGANSGAGSASAPRPPDAAPSAGIVDQRRNAPTPAPPVATNGRVTKGTTATEEQKQETEDTGLLAWAKDQHQRLIAQVSRGNCKDATQTALALSGKAPGYYAQNVESDRTVKNCMQYINAEREKEAERAQRTRGAAKRPAADEAAKRNAPKAATDRATNKAAE